MGIKLNKLKCCCKSTSASSDLAPGEQEIPFPVYKSKNDEKFKKLEYDNNLLLHLPLIEYVNLLAKFSMDTSTVPRAGELVSDFGGQRMFLEEHVNYEEFIVFINDKILKHPKIYSKTENKELVRNFKLIFLQIFNSLILKLGQNSNTKLTSLTKNHLLCFGLLYCNSNNIGKIKLIFDLFKSPSHLFFPCEEFSELLLSLFITSSYGMIDARNKLSKENEAFSLTKEEKISLLQVSELKDSQNLVKVFNEKFFDGGKGGMNWAAFKDKFRGEEGFGWVFSGKGIREMLIKNNV